MLPRLLSLLLLVSFSVKAQEFTPLPLEDFSEMPKTLHAFNSNLLTATAFQGISYGSREIEGAIKDLRPGGLRFPGGTTANNYLWKEDSFSLQKNDQTKWAGQQLELFRKIGKKYDLPGYVRLCQEQKLSPIWVLNIYEETPESVRELLDHLETLGLELKAIELGNEPYWDPRSLMNVWKYMEFCRPLAGAIREHSPEIAIGACFGPVREDATYAEKWNAPLAKQSWYDAIVYHEYYGGQGFAMEAGEALSLEAVLHPERFIDEAVEHFDELLPGKPIWFTEWNIGQKGLEQWKNTGAELLFLGAAVSRIVEHRDSFEWSCFHQLYEAKFGTMYYDKESGLQTLPSYEFFRMLGAVWDGGTEVASVNGGPNTDVIGFAVRKDQNTSWFLVNRSSEPALVELRDAVGMSGLSLAVQPEQKVGFSSKLTKPLAVEDGEVVLPPYSINLVGSNTLVEAATRQEQNESRNLFPVRPHLTLWYPPYARKQPRVSADGSYRVDFSAFADKKTAQITLNLEGIRPEPGQRYAVSFKAKAEPAIGFVPKLPAAEDGAWTQLSPKEGSVRYEFTYDPERNGGALSLFFAEGAIARAGTLSMSEFSIKSLSPAE